MEKKAPTIAAIDIGTNSFHLVITSVNTKGILHAFTKEKEMVRLGSGSGDMKILQPDAIERGINTLKYFSELAQSKNAEIIAVATSAVREAENKDEFIKLAKETTGIDIQVISGLEEGRLIYVGVIHALPLLNKKILVIDIGGGSTETIVGDHGEIIYQHSAKLGAIRLTKKFNLDTDPSKKNINSCREYIHGEWSPIINRLKNCKPDAVVGTSGTILSLAIMAMYSEKNGLPEILNGIVVTREKVQEVINKIIKSKSVEERLKINNIDQTRADIILGGALIFEYIINSLKIDKFYISSYALREGVVFNAIEKFNKSNTYQHLNRLRFESIMSVAKQFNVDLNHAQHVMKTSLRLFDDLQELHKFGPEEREMLQAAAILHDSGYHISHDMHHKHSYYIIKNCMLPGFTNDEKELIANIARYHRKSHPKKKHENFKVLSAQKQKIVQVLASFLRIGEGIDRRQLQYVADISGELNGKIYTLTITPSDDNQDLDIEIWGANRRKFLLEESLKINIKFEQK